MITMTAVVSPVEKPAYQSPLSFSTGSTNVATGRRHWRDRAICRGAPLSLFISDEDYEPPVPPPEARAFCDRCPVRVECLEWAMACGDMPGVFGGTTSYQRRALARVRERARCLACSSRDLVYRGNLELCLACGMSWWVV
jgi:WhiB family redox-sensing transcriptional regulator